MNTPVPTGKLARLAKRYGTRSEFASRFAAFRNPYDYYMFQRKRKDKVKQTPIVPVSQRKVKVIKRDSTQMEVS